MSGSKLVTSFLMMHLLASGVFCSPVPVVAVAPGERTGSAANLISSFTLSSYSSSNAPADEQESFDEVDTGVDDKIQCILHHEYAVFVHPDDLSKLNSGFFPRADMPIIRTYVNRHGRTKHYFCHACGSCGEGVRILTQCHLRQDIVCSNLCIDPTWIYDSRMRRCYSAGASSTSASTTDSTTQTKRYTSSSGFIPIFITEDGGTNGIGEEELEPTDHHHFTYKLTHQIIPITVGVVTLNVMVAILLVWKRRDLRRKKTQMKLQQQEQERRNRNNVVNATPSPETERLDIETQNPPPSSISVTIPTEVEHIDDININNSTRRVKESNLNQYVVNFQPGLDITTEVTRALQVDAEPHVTVKPGDDPFWIEMSGEFGPEGGVISCDQSDVVLEIPPGAIPPTHPKQPIIVRVSTTLSTFSIPLQKGSMFLSPLVECKSPGLKSFKKDVVIKLPHRAQLGPGWKFAVHYTDDSEEADWKTVSACYKDLQNVACIKTSSVCIPEAEVKFTVDGKYVNIATPHFSRYTCSGCACDGKDGKRQLSLEAVVYVNDIHQETERRVDLHCYLLDTIKDFQRKIDGNEKYRARSAHKPLPLDIKKGDANLEVSLAEMSAEWPWKVDARFHQTKQVVRLVDILRCHSDAIPYFVTFTLRSTLSKAFLEAVVVIKQTKKPTDVKIDIAMNLDNNVIDNDVDETGDNQRDDLAKIFTYLSGRIRAQEWRPLYRCLMTSASGNLLNIEADINFIETMNPRDLKENIYQGFLSWLTKMGRGATFKRLCNCLRNNELVALADDVEEQFQKEETVAVVEKMQQLLIETDV